MYPEVLFFWIMATLIILFNFNWLYQNMLKLIVFIWSFNKVIGAIITIGMMIQMYLEYINM